MSKDIITIDNFSGGLSSSSKRGIEGSYLFGRSIETREEPNSFTLVSKTAKESGVVVSDLIKWFEPVGTDMYSYGDTGKIYKRTSGATWSALTTVSNSSGNGLGFFAEDDFLYYSSDSVIGRYGPISGSPSFNDDFFTDDTYNKDRSLSTSGNTYTLATSINEGATHRQTFVPDRDPQATVEVLIADKGTGNWTVTVHDPANTEVAALTIANGSVTNGDQKFTFATAWRPVRGANYHFHVTSTVADGTVTTTDSADLETVDFTTYYQVLVTDTDYHPIVEHLNKLAIGNGRYVATWDGIIGGGNTNYSANEIELPSGWKIRDLESTGEYLVIVAWKGSAITDYEDSMLFFWDGISTSINFFVPIKEGVASSGVSSEGRFYYITTRGDIYVWNGNITKLQKIPGLTQKTYLEVFPDAMKMWQGLIRIGVAGSTNSSAIEQGVYTWGSKSTSYPETLTYDYPVSTGTRKSTGLKISALGVRANTLFTAFDDNGTFGVDTVTTTANPFANGVYETVIIDGGVPWKEKEALTIIVTHEALDSGESIQIGHKINRASSFTTGDVNSTSGSIETRLPINKRFQEIQIQVIPAASGSTSPRVITIAFAYDNLIDEEVP